MVAICFKVAAPAGSAGSSNAATAKAQLVLRRMACLGDMNRSPLAALGAGIVLTSRLFVKRVIKRKLPGKPLLVREPKQREAFRNGAQPRTLLRNVLLPLDVSSTDDQGQAFQSRFVELVIHDDRFKRAPLGPMVEFDCGQPRGVEGNGILLPRRRQQFFFCNEDELGGGVNEASDQPGTGYSVDFDVAARNPLHDTPPTDQPFEAGSRDVSPSLNSTPLVLARHPSLSQLIERCLEGCRQFFH